MRHLCLGRCVIDSIGVGLSFCVVDVVFTECSVQPAISKATPEINGQSTVDVLCALGLARKHRCTGCETVNKRVAADK